MAFYLNLFQDDGQLQRQHLLTWPNVFQVLRLDQAYFSLTQLQLEVGQANLFLGGDLVWQAY